MHIRSLAAAGLLCGAAAAQATILVNSPSFVYSETFDSLVTAPSAFVNDSTLAGWSLFRTAGTVSLIQGNGSSNSGGLYAFGVTGAVERALGSIASGSTGTNYIVGAFTNGTGTTITDFTAAFAGEQWRNGGNTAVHSLTAQYGFGATYAGVSWTALPSSFTVNSLVNTSTAAAVVGNTTGRTNGLGGTVLTNWTAGDTLWLRWVDLDNTGSDHGLAIDDFSLRVTAVPEPGALALLMAGLGVIVTVARRRA